jgi:uncharacterized SAM-binding protein YcdF (DUF218 family)
MNASPAPLRRSLGITARLLLGAVLLASGWFAITCGRIVRQAGKDEERPAAAIVVFGAAEYQGRPSPVYRARLDHAYELFERHIAPIVITTGGAGDDPNYSEGGVGRDYLQGRCIPASRVMAETQALDTFQSARRVAAMMRASGMRTCVAVSDADHVYRVKMMLESQGITTYASPRPDSRPRSLWERGMAVAREAASYCLWRLNIT